MNVVVTSCCCEMFSSAPARGSSTVTTTYTRPGPSSLLGAPPLLGAPSRPFGLRGISHGQIEPVGSGAFQAQGFPRPSSRLPNQQQQQQIQPGQQRYPAWLERPYSTPHQQFRAPLRTAAPVPNMYQSDSTRMRNNPAGMRGGRGRGGQHAATRPPAPTNAARTAVMTQEMRRQLLDVFPDNVNEVDTILAQNRHIHSVDELCLKVSEIV